MIDWPTIQKSYKNVEKINVDIVLDTVFIPFSFVCADFRVDKKRESFAQIFFERRRFSRDIHVFCNQNYVTYP